MSNYFLVFCLRSSLTNEKKKKTRDRVLLSVEAVLYLHAMKTSCLSMSNYRKRINFWECAIANRKKKGKDKKKKKQEAKHETPKDSPGR